MLFIVTIYLSTDRFHGIFDYLSIYLSVIDLYFYFFGTLKFFVIIEKRPTLGNGCFCSLGRVNRTCTRVVKRELGLNTAVESCNKHWFLK